MVRLAGAKAFRFKRYEVAVNTMMFAEPRKRPARCRRSSFGGAVTIATAILLTCLPPITASRGADASAIVAEVAALRTKVRSGDPMASFQLATLDYVGIGVIQDYIGAVNLLKAASAAGIGEAACELGFLYQTGSFAQGPPPSDPAQAAPWYQKSAALGDPWGEFALAALYENGLGLKKDTKQAALLLAEASAKGVVADPTTFPLEQMQRHFYGIAFQLTGQSDWVDVVSRTAGGDN
jgi:TPR repeat protein